MGTHSCRQRNRSLDYIARQLTCIVIILSLAACAPVTVEVAPPQVPEVLQGVVIEVPPDTLALTRLEMPAGFHLAAEKQEGPEYVALYLRPAALDPAAAGGNSLLSVLSTVGVYTTTAAAEEIYAAASKPTQQAIEDIALVSNNATDIVTVPFEDAVQGADAAEAFHVSYKLMGQSVYEYGHRLRVGNVIAYVVVAAIGNPDEPPHLLVNARDIVQRQIDKIAASVDVPGEVGQSLEQ